MCVCVCACMKVYVNIHLHIHVFVCVYMYVLHRENGFANGLTGNHVRYYYLISVYIVRHECSHMPSKHV